MSFWGRVNLCLGFWMILFASIGGAFLGHETQMAFLLNKELLSSWQFMLMRSAHAHTNLFGLLHVLVGLTLPYVRNGLLVEKLTTLLIFSGSVAMSSMLLIRSYIIPSNVIEPLGIVTGILLSFALIGLLLHSIGLTKRVFR